MFMVLGQRTWPSLPKPTILDSGKTVILSKNQEHVLIHFQKGFVLEISKKRFYIPPKRTNNTKLGVMLFHSGCQCASKASDSQQDTGTGLRDKEIKHVENVGKGGAREIPMICLMKSWKSWMWDQYCPKNMKWEILKIFTWDQYLPKKGMGNCN